MHLDKIYLTKILDFTHPNCHLTNKNGGQTPAQQPCCDATLGNASHTGMHPPVIKHGKLGYGDGSKPYPPVVHIKIAGKWMFIPLKMAFIGIDPWPYPL